ncbi:MAG: hypothetical protein WBM04_00445 [Candidatus Korobacteraceae bacterium]
MIEGAIRDFTILNTESLSNQQKYHLIRDELNHRMRRFLIASITAVTIALALLSALVILQKGEWFGPSGRKEPAQTFEREQPNLIGGKVKPQPTDTAVNAEPKLAVPRKSTTDENSIRENPASNQSNNMGAVEAGPPTLPPKVMHFCAVNCFTLTLDDGGKHFTARNDDGVAFSTWTIESFARESVILRRRDANGFSVVYAGQISKEGGNLINQTCDGRPDSAAITWGPKLNDTPGTNAERDRLRGTATR